ncbi:MAG: hypothetical protein H6658_00210 [Ardenticatenaceae bacterium]|nr:hypothetical protein [Ardenticatenaceae bacterium]
MSFRTVFGEKPRRTCSVQVFLSRKTVSCCGRCPAALPHLLLVTAVSPTHISPAYHYAILTIDD